MKHPADFVTALRIIFAIGLLLVKPFSPLFFTFYLICGMSDVFDGIIARKTHTEHLFGAKFDTFADALFFLICIVVILPILKLHTNIWILIIIIAVIKIINQMIAFYRHHQFASIHSILNKATGILIYFFPVFCYFFDDNFVAIPLCILALTASISEFYYICQGKLLLK